MDSIRDPGDDRRGIGRFSGSGLGGTASRIGVREGGTLIDVPKDAAFRRPEDLIGFEADLRILSAMDHPSILKVADWRESGKRWEIRFEPFDGDSLDSASGRRLLTGAEAAVGLAIAAAEALRAAHEQGLLHRGLAPSDILVGPPLASGFPAVKIANFAVARFRSRDGDEGGLRYMAPEQTGAIAHPEDARTDLYRLGAILHELITGRTAFPDANLGEIVRRQVLDEAADLPALERASSPALAGIVRRLLARDPDERYRGASGLIDDLLAFRRGETVLIRGGSEGSAGLNARTPLFGREREIAALQAGLENAFRGKGGTILLIGEAGIGKTRLLDEIARSSETAGAVVVRAEGRPGSVQAPYAPVSDLLDSYLKEFIAKPAEEKAEIVQALLEGTERADRILASVNPRVGAIFGMEREVSERRATGDLMRFAECAAEFFSLAARGERCLTVLIDNLQWFDEGSLGVARAIAEAAPDGPVLMVCAIRSPDAGSREGGDPAFGVGGRSLPIGPLDRTSLDRYAEALLSGRVSGRVRLLDHVWARSGGNPFLAGATLRKLSEDGVLRVRRNAWEYDSDSLDSPAAGEGIAGILIGRLALLAPFDRRVLGIASVIGKTFRRARLSRAVRAAGVETDDEGGVQAALERARGLNLVDGPSGPDESFSFAHDKIREAFHASMTDAERRTAHVAEAEACLASLDDRRVFEAADHFIIGGDDARALDCLYRAGIAAKESYANEQAARYLGMALERMPPGDARAAGCLEALGDACNLLGFFEEATARLNEALALSSSDMDRVRIHLKLSWSRLRDFDGIRCESDMANALSILGQKMPSGSIGKAFSIAIELAKRLLPYRRHAVASGDRPGGDRGWTGDSKRAELIVAALVQQVEVFYFIDYRMMLWVILRSLNLSERRIGPSGWLGLCMVMHSGFLMEYGAFKRAARYQETGLAMVERTRDPDIRKRAYRYVALYDEWAGKYMRCLEYLGKVDRVIDAADNVRDRADQLQRYFYVNYLMCDYAEALAAGPALRRIGAALKDDLLLFDSYLQEAFIAADRDDAPALEKAVALMTMLRKNAEYPHWRLQAAAMRGMLGLKLGRIDEGIASLEEARRILDAGGFARHYSCFAYPWLCEAYQLKWEGSEGGAARDGLLRVMRRVTARSMRATRLKPAYHGLSILYRAMYLEASGRPRSADRFYREAIAHSLRYGRRNVLARSRLAYGLFLRKRRNENSAMTQLKMSYSVFKELKLAKGMREAASAMGFSAGPREAPRDRIRDEAFRDRAAAIMAGAGRVSSPAELGAFADEALGFIMEWKYAGAACVIVERDGDGGLELLAQRSAAESDAAYRSIPLRAAFEALASGETVIIDEATGSSPPASRACFPVRYRGGIRAVCVLADHRLGLDFDSSGQDLIEAIIAYLLVYRDNLSLQRPRNKGIDLADFETACARYGLTKREAEIFSLLVGGSSNKEICERRGVTRGTLRTHLNNIYKKIGINDRDALARHFGV